jgi:putative transcriptional regulator
MKLSDLKNIDVEATARAIEADEGEPIPELREALEQTRSGEIGRVTTPTQLILREARRCAGLSQCEFARRIDTPVATLRDWEQGRFSPPGAVGVLARLITKHPELAAELQSA